MPVLYLYGESNRAEFLWTMKKTMESRGTLLKTRDVYSAPHDKAVIRGEFMPSSRGFGFVRRSGGEGEDIFVPARYTLGALAGDTVELLVKENKRQSEFDRKFDATFELQKEKHSKADDLFKKALEKAEKGEGEDEDKT